MNFSSSLRQLIPASFQPAAKAVYYKLFRLYLRLRFVWSDRFVRPMQGIPVPPALLRYRVSELISVNLFLRSGEGCAGLIQRSANEMGVDFDRTKRVLDFGCGCGRTIAWLLRDYEAEFHGVDVDADAVAWCRRHLARGHFIANPPVPPLPYPDEYFDLVYCLSVFTHLDEPMQDAWLSELSRTLKPGGTLLFTVFGSPARKRLATKELRQLEIHGLVHKRSQKLRGLVPDWYHTTFHARDYIVQRLSQWFDDIHYTVVPDGMQDVVAAVKPGRSALRSAQRSSTMVHPDEESPLRPVGRSSEAGDVR